MPPIGGRAALLSALGVLAVGLTALFLRRRAAGSSDVVATSEEVGA